MNYDKPVTRINNITESTFIADFLKANQPLIVTGAMDGWINNSLWSFEKFAEEFGTEMIQVYNDRFDLKDITSLRTYIAEYIGKKYQDEIVDGDRVTYARLYAKMKDVEFAWADEIFEKIQDRWSVPDFIPRTGYVLPYSNEALSPLTNRFPGKVIFLSSGGSRTSLHIDPWGSDAVLCQIVGVKEVMLYAPDQVNYLKNGDTFADPDNVDDEAYPDYSGAVLSYHDVLQPGETLFIPNGWLHHVRTLEDSISLSWNFVHHTTIPTVDALIRSDYFNSDHDKEVLDFFTTGAYLQ